MSVLVGASRLVRHLLAQLLVRSLWRQLFFLLPLIELVICVIIRLSSLICCGVCLAHHLRCHEFVLQDLFRVYALSRVQAHYLIEQVDEFGVADPLIAAEVEAFLEHGHQITQAWSKQLVLSRHDLSVVTPCHAEQSHVDAAVAIKHQYSAFQREPERESGQHFEQDASQRPNVEDERDLCEVLHTHVCLLSEPL